MNHHPWTLLVGVALLAGCPPKVDTSTDDTSGDTGDTGGGGTTDTNGDTGTGSGTDPATYAVPDFQAVVSTVSDDYSSAALSTIGVQTYAVEDDVLPLSTDTIVSAGLKDPHDQSVKEVALLDRVNSTVTLYEIMKQAEPDWNTPTLQFALEEGANPQAIQMC